MKIRVKSVQIIIFRDEKKDDNNAEPGVLPVNHLDGGLPLLHLGLDGEGEAVSQGPAHGQSCKLRALHMDRVIRTGP